MNTYTIETARLHLQPYRMDDLDALYRIFTDPGVRRYLLDDEIVSREWVRDEIAASQALFAAEGYGQWAVFPTDDASVLIGFCGFRHFHTPPELQLIYGLLPAYWGRGLAAEAARALIRYGFETCGFETILASADAPHTASFRVMEKTGMTFLKRVEIDGLDTVYYAITRADFEAIR